MTEEENRRVEGVEHGGKDLFLFTKVKDCVHCKNAKRSDKNYTGGDWENNYVAF